MLALHISLLFDLLISLSLGRSESSILPMAHSERVIKYPNELCPYEPKETYRGEVSGAGPSKRRHGSGVMEWSDGRRYVGEWREDKMSGRGVMEYRNGCRYEGEWRNDEWCGRGVYTLKNGDRYDGEVYGVFNGRGVYRYAAGRRLYDGAWAHSYPAGGAALDGDGVVWRAVCDERARIDVIWKKDRGMPVGWTRAGVTVTAGRQPAEAPGSGEWAGTWAWEGGARVEGLLRGLRPVAGLETDVGGGRWWLTYDGERTLAEELVVKSRTVRTQAKFWRFWRPDKVSKSVG